MHTEKASEWDVKLMDRALREARTELAYGGAGVVALLASPDQILAIAHNTIRETGDLTNHAEMVAPLSWPAASRNERTRSSRPHALRYVRTLLDVQCRSVVCRA